MTLPETIELVCILLACLFVMITVSIGAVSEARHRRAEVRREIAKENREVERHKQQTIIDAQIVEMLRTVSEQGHEGAKLSRALLGYIQQQGEAQKKHFEQSIESFFNLHKGQAAIMEHIGTEHEKTRIQYARGLDKRGLGR